jgi:hypothetical protein
MGTSAIGQFPCDFAIGQHHGTIPRVIQQMFDTIKAHVGKITYKVKVSFLEIHNEAVKDLLNKSGSAPTLSIKRKKTDGSIEVPGSIAETVTSAEDMWKCLEKGSRARAVGGTAMNAESSRSHAIFTVYLTQRKIKVTNNNPDEKEEKDSKPKGSTENVTEEKEGKNTKPKETTRNLTGSCPQNQISSKDSVIDDAADNHEDAVMTSKFHFVDLAGSERIKRTSAVGKRMKEGININRGLHVLANVISALALKQSHVPFRESKITRMLQDSLGGNSQTLMLACISPADVNCEETINTLRYANRARKIKNKAVINMDPNVAKIRRLRTRIQELEAHWTIQGKTERMKAAHRAKKKKQAAKAENQKGNGPKPPKPNPFLNQIKSCQERIATVSKKQAGETTIQKQSRIAKMEKQQKKLKNLKEQSKAWKRSQLEKEKKKRENIKKRKQEEHLKKKKKKKFYYF